MQVDKNSLAKRLITELSTPQKNVLAHFMGLLVEDLRVRNDTADSRQVLRNQGAIKELKRLQDIFKPKEETKHFDGAFS